MIVDCEIYISKKPVDGVNYGLRELAALEDEAGVDYAILMPEPTMRPDNSWLRDVASGQKRFLPCACINPGFGEEGVREFETAVKEWGFRGLKLMPPKHGFRIVDKPVYPLMRKAAELGVPVSIHSGQDYCHPLEIAALAMEFPQVPVIMDHMGYRYYSREAVIAGKLAKNVYLATTAVMEPSVIKTAVDTLGPGRVVFGSNGPTVPPIIQIMVIKRAGLSPEA